MGLPLGCYLRSGSETTWLNEGNAQVQSLFYISSLAFPRNKFSVYGGKNMSDDMLRLQVSLQEQLVILCVDLKVKW